ncbi:hypothetical protein [Nitrosopumilus sp.]|uniref:hypothetical protein n=1 Tax=Nitrosopumilus sp. TaxID=2024843 RepID=UPI00247C11F1|nr:hypothetical protein [Nitrosopumilus sp.]MCV0430699.1 hypothetical protein [Nitrosopumilus sp.]
MEQTILPITLLPIVSGLIVAGYGAYKETRYVSSLSIAFTVANVLVTLLFTNIYSISFVVWAIISVFGVMVIIYDVKKNYQNPYVAFFLGSKTIGSLTIFLGLAGNNWVKPIFEPIFWFIVSNEAPQLSNFEVSVLVHLLGSLIILGMIHLAGAIIGKLHEK